MSKPDSNPHSDAISGFFISVLAALLLSNMMAKGILKVVTGYFELADIANWQSNLVAGLFVGIVMADPFGVIMNKRRIKPAFVRLFVGIIVGVLLQKFVVMPIAGSGMSRFLFLILATLLVPVFFCVTWLQGQLDARGIVLGQLMVQKALIVMSWPDRMLIILTMALSFLIFWFFVGDLDKTFIGMAAVLITTTLYVAFTRPVVVEEEDDPWFYQDAETEEEAPEITISELASARFAELMRTLVPGAILLGGAMRVAVEYLMLTFPHIDTVLQDDPVETAQTLGMFAATGLGVVLFGMLAALGLGLGVLLLIGRIAGRSNDHLREGCWRLVRVLCFRPIGRAH